MSLLCRAFAYQPCSNKKYVLKTVICCHTCPDYKYCPSRCNNKPSICGKGEKTEVEYHGGRITRPVAKYSVETDELLEVYPSTKIAATENNLVESSLRGALNSDKGLLNGSKWRYNDGQTD